MNWKLSTQNLLLVFLALSAACSINPSSRKQRNVESGQRYFDEGKFSEAKIEFINALKIDSRDSDLHFRLATTYIKLKQWPHAYEELERTLDLQPENYSARFELAKLLISTGSLQQAQDQTDVLLQKRPNDPKTHFLVSNLLAARGKFAEAIEEIQRSIALAPGEWDSYLNLALMQMKNNQPDLAEANFKKSIELNPTATDTRTMLGDFYQYRGRVTEAEQQFRGAIAVDPQNPNLRASLARLYLSEGRKAQAEDYLKQVKHDFPNTSAGYRMLGDFYFTNGDLDRALAEYGSLHSEHPADLETKKNYIQLLILTDHLDDARKLNAEFAKENPSDKDGWLYAGEIQIRDGRPGDAVSTLQRVIQNDSTSAAAHYQLGIALQQSGEQESAEREWREAVRLRPDMIDAQRSLALLAMRKGDMATLQQAATQLISLQPFGADGYALRAVSEINLKQFGAGEADIRQATEIAPQSHLGYVQLGNLRFEQQRFTEAANAYQQALDRNPNSTDALRGLMNSYISQKQIDKALAAAETQIGKSPNNGDFYDLLGTTLFNNKHNLVAAEAALRKSNLLDGKNPDPVIKLVQVQISQGRFEDAIATCERGLKEFPRELVFYLQLGNIYQSRQDWQKAEDSYQKALTLSPQNPLASGALASVMLILGQNLDVALSLAQSARQSLPQSPEIAETMGWVYYQKGAYQLAVNHLREAVNLESKAQVSQTARVHYRLGMAYVKTGETATARQQLQLMLKLDPSSPDAEDAKQQLAKLKS